MSLQWCGNVTSITIFLNTCPLKYIFIIEKTKTNKNWKKQAHSGN